MLRFFARRPAPPDPEARIVQAVERFERSAERVRAGWESATFSNRGVADHQEAQAEHARDAGRLAEAILAHGSRSVVCGGRRYTAVLNPGPGNAGAVMAAPDYRPGRPTVRFNGGSVERIF